MVRSAGVIINFTIDFIYLKQTKESMSDWNTYAEQVKNRFDYDTNDWAVNNVCSGAGIYGQDGSVWGVSADMPELKTYTHDLEDMDGSIE